MNQSFRIGSVFGITVRVHALLLFLLALWLLQSPGRMGETLVLMGTLLTTVFLHELGHGLVAQRHGIRVVDITFWPLGGLARMSEIPQDWRIESQIAFAGPAVNFLLAGLAAPVLVVLGPEGALGGFAASFLWINLVLGLFNLIPAFPMDGARVLRALLARKSDWLAATERTASIGRGLAFVLAFVGLAVTVPVGALSGCIFSFLFAGWIWWSCTQEVLAVRMRNLRTAFEGAGPTGPFGPFGPFRAGGSGGEGPFGGPGGTGPFGSPGEPPRDDAGPARPTEPPTPPHGGFSDDDVEALERFRGSLRGRRRDPE